MRSDLRQRLNRSLYRGLGEDFVIYPVDGSLPVRARGRWFDAGSETAGATDVELRVEGDTIEFRNSDTAAVAALQSGENVEVERVATATRFVVQGIGELRSARYSVRVVEAGR